MKILPFLSSLAQTFQRDDINQQVADLRDGLITETIAPYEIAGSELGTFKSPQGKNFEAAFRREVDTQYRGDALDITVQCLKNLQSNLGLLEGLVEKSFSRDVVVAGMTYKKANVLQLLAMYDFGTDYARQVLLYLLACEANVKAKTLTPGKERPTPELKWLADNQSAYFKVLGLMSYRTQELTKLLDAIPEIVVNPDSSEITEVTVGAAKIDPLRMGIIPLGINPFYYVGIRYANWQAMRNNRRKNEKRALEMRLEQLRLQRNGQEDAVLENRIDFYEDEVNKIAAKIAKFEA